MFGVSIHTFSGKLWDGRNDFQTENEAEIYADEVKNGEHGPSAADVKSIEVYEIEATVEELLAAHLAPSDAAAKPLAAALREQGEVLKSAGTPGLDYTALIKFGGETWLVEDNNGWTRIYDPSDADYDVAEVFAAAEE